MKLWLAPLALILVACGAETPAVTPTGCTPGRIEACPCAIGQGAQTCQRDGTYGACVCSDAGPGVDVDRADAPIIDRTPFDVTTVRDEGPIEEVMSPDVRDVVTCDADLQRNPDHCGACGNVCPNGGGCAEGRCQPGRCQVTNVPCRTNAECIVCHYRGETQAPWCCVGTGGVTSCLQYDGLECPRNP